MNANADLTGRLRELVASELDVRLSANEIDENTDLFAGKLGIDSIALVELITLVEENFGVDLGYDDLRPENFRTLSALAGLLGRKLETKEEGRATPATEMNGPR